MRFGLDVAQQPVSWDELVHSVPLAEILGFDGVWGSTTSSRCTARGRARYSRA